MTDNPRDAALHRQMNKLRGEKTEPEAPLLAEEETDAFDWHDLDATAAKQVIEPAPPPAPKLSPEEQKAAAARAAEIRAAHLLIAESSAPKKSINKFAEDVTQHLQRLRGAPDTPSVAPAADKTAPAKPAPAKPAPAKPAPVAAPLVAEPAMEMRADAPKVPPKSPEPPKVAAPKIDQPEQAVAQKSVPAPQAIKPEPKVDLKADPALNSPALTPRAEQPQPDFKTVIAEREKRIEARRARLAARREPRFASSSPSSGGDYIALDMPADYEGRTGAPVFTSPPPNRRSLHWLEIAAIVGLCVAVPSSFNVISKQQGAISKPSDIADLPDPERMTQSVPQQAATQPPTVAKPADTAAALTPPAAPAETTPKVTQDPPKKATPAAEVETAALPAPVAKPAAKAASPAEEEPFDATALVTGAGSAAPPAADVVPLSKVTLKPASAQPSQQASSGAMTVKPFDPAMQPTSVSTGANGLPNITPPSSGPFGALPKSTASSPKKPWLTPQPFQP